MWHNLLRCRLCGQDTHFTFNCPKLLPRQCYKCRQPGHYAAHCPNRPATPPVAPAPALEPEAQEAPDYIRRWVEQLPLERLRAELNASVSASRCVRNQSASTEASHDLPGPSRKRPVDRRTPSSGPSHRFRERSSSPVAGPSHFAGAIADGRPLCLDTHFHPDTMQHQGIPASNWLFDDTSPIRFGGAIACFAYPALYMDRDNVTRDRLFDLLRSDTLPRRAPLLGGQFGCHPRSAGQWILGRPNGPDGRSFLALQRIFQQADRVPVRPLAVGEAGIDLFGNVPPLETQRRVFVDQIRVAAACSVPIVLHLRAETEKDDRLESDAIELLRKYAPTTQKIHRHCYRHSSEVAWKWIRRFPNTKFGITGVLLNPARVRLPEIEFATNFPLEYLVLESDSPHLAASPRKAPTDVLLIAERIAYLRGMDVGTVARVTTRNAEELYGIRVTP